MIRKIFRISVICFAVCFALYAAYWYWSALQLVSVMDRDIQRLQQSGLDIRYESQQTAGFPTRLKLKVSKLQLYEGAVSAAGTATEEVTDIEEGQMPIAAIDKFALTTKVVNPLTYLTDNLSSDANGMRLDLLEALTFAGRDIVFIEGAMHPLPDRIENLALTVSGTGVMPSLGTQKQKMQAWQQTGGEILVHDFAVEWGNLLILASGTVGLDEKMQIAGKLDMRAAGLPDFLIQLGQMGLLDPQLAVLVSEGIKFFAVPTELKDADSAEKEASAPRREFFSVPLVFEDGDLKLGPVSLLQIGPIIQ